MKNFVRKSVKAPPNYSVLNVNRLLTNWILRSRFSFAHRLGRAAGSPPRWSLGAGLHGETSGGLSWRDWIQGWDQTYTVSLTTWQAMRNTRAQLCASCSLSFFLGIHAENVCHMHVLHYLQYLLCDSWHFQSCGAKKTKHTYMTAANFMGHPPASLNASTTVRAVKHSIYALIDEHQWMLVSDSTN